jgi:hypothetical protein
LADHIYIFYKVYHQVDLTQPKSPAAYGYCNILLDNAVFLVNFYVNTLFERARQVDRFWMASSESNPITSCESECSKNKAFCGFQMENCAGINRMRIQFLS